MNLKIGRKIGEGACSEVFEWENEYKIIKLAKSNTNIYTMRREYENNRIVWENGLSVPQPLEFLELNGRPGVIFERIYGESLMERFIKQLKKRSTLDEGIEEEDEYNNIRITAQILNEVHNYKINLDLPNQREVLKYSINSTDYLTTVEKESVIEILDRLPLKQQLCHGDPNPGNILIRNGKAVLIDWMGASIGNPEADLAEYIIMVKYAILQSYLPYLPNESVDYFNSIRETMINVFIDEYTILSGITYDEIDAWIAPIAARKLSADICEEERNLLLQEIRKRLKR